MKTQAEEILHGVDAKSLLKRPTNRLPDVWSTARLRAVVDESGLDGAMNRIPATSIVDAELKTLWAETQLRQARIFQILRGQ